MTAADKTRVRQFAIYWSDKWGNEKLANIGERAVFDTREDADELCKNATARGSRCGVSTSAPTLSATDELAYRTAIELKAG